MYLILNREGIIITLKSLFVTMQRRNIDEYDKRLRHDTHANTALIMRTLNLSSTSRSSHFTKMKLEADTIS
jgi:hypothetical protein